MDNAAAAKARLAAQILIEVAALPLEERAVAIDTRCGDDHELKAGLDHLLGVPRIGVIPVLVDIPQMQTELAQLPDIAGVSLGCGAKIGRYKLLQPLGEGGFGSVFMAEQERPIRRRVALKIIKPGMDTRQVIARFEAERQALAMMDHPNIAKVLDAGATENGRPYFVMELVRGVPITEYCDKNKLTVRERVELFMPACQAVQHAHQKGIIHRDIKPSNVLIALHDGKPAPKVIDFGIAKATQAKLTDKTLVTEFHQLMGTPEYMSPEQAEMGALDLDTRADIYSLGVLLYELLTGTTPFEAKELRAKPPGEIERIIREVDPPPPSTRLATLGDRLVGIASRRGAEAKKLNGQIRGDLDWIVMKCLEKDRTRRYETVNALLQDVNGHLKGEAVLAHSPSRTYRLLKFAHRHKRPLAITTLLIFMLLAATAGALRFALQQRGLADERKGFLQEKERSIADLHEIQATTNTQLYHALLRESAARRIAREPGYRHLVWENLLRANALKTPERDAGEIATEAMACLGDPLGLDPVPTPDVHSAVRPPIPVEFAELLSKRQYSKYVASPDGKWLMTLNDGSPLTIWSSVSKSPVAVAPVELGGKVYDAEFCPQSKLIALGCVEGMILYRVPKVRAPQPAEPYRLEQHSIHRGDTVLSVSFQPGGDLLAFTNQTRTTLWSVRSNIPIASLANTPNENFVRFSSDGQLLLTSASASKKGFFRGWPTANTPERLTLAGHDGGVPGLAYSPDGTRLTSVSKDGNVKIWNATTGALLHSLKEHRYPIQSVCNHPDGTLLATADISREIIFWETQTGHVLGRIDRTMNHAGQWKLLFDASGKYLVAAGSGGVQAWAIAREGQAVIAESFLRIPRSREVTDLSIHPSGTEFAFVARDSTDRKGAYIYGYDLREMLGPRRVGTSYASDDFHALHFAVDGGTLHFTTPMKRSAALAWPSGAPAILPDYPAACTAASIDGRWIATIAEGKNGKSLVVYDLESKRAWGTFRITDAVWTLAFSPDNSRIAIGCADGRMAIWNLEAVRSALAEFDAALPSTAVRKPLPPHPAPLSEAMFDQIVRRHKAAAQTPPSTNP